MCVCVCVEGEGASHTNIPTHPLNKNNTVSHKQLCWHSRPYLKYGAILFLLKVRIFGILQQEIITSDKAELSHNIEHNLSNHKHQSIVCESNSESVCKGGSAP